MIKAGVSMFMLMFMLDTAYLETGNLWVFLSVFGWPITTERRR